MRTKFNAEKFIIPGFVLIIAAFLILMSTGSESKPKELKQGMITTTNHYDYIQGSTAAQQEYKLK